MFFCQKCLYIYIIIYIYIYTRSLIALCLVCVCVCVVPNPAMLLVEMLLDRLLCVLKKLGCRRSNITGVWSSQLVTVLQWSHEEEEEEVEEADGDATEDVAKYEENIEHSLLWSEMLEMEF